MIARLLHILGLSPDSGPPEGELAGVSFFLSAGGVSIFVAVLSLVALAVATALLYRREIHSVRLRLALVSLRVLAFSLLVLMLLGPTLSLSYTESTRRQLLVLRDTTGSMALRDVRREEPDIARAARFPEVGAAPSRESLTRAALSPALLADLARLVDVRLFNFDTRLTPADEAAFAATRPTASATPLGNILRDALTHTRGQPLAGILLATDGGSNSGLSPLSAATLAAGANVPIYTYGVGVARPRDVVAQSLTAPDVGFVGDEISAELRYRAIGVEPGQKAVVKLRLGETSLPDQVLQLNTETLTIRFTPPAAGELSLTAEITPLPGESIPENNSTSTRLRIVDGKIKVLYIESAPRWEFKYLQALLLRDRRVAPKFLLLGAAASVAEGADSPYVAAFPASKEALFAYDLVILGDVDPKALPATALPWLGEHVGQFGGGLVLLAGRSSLPSLYSGSALDALVPVIASPAPAVAPLPSATDGAAPLRLELTAAGRQSAMLRLAADEAASAARWSQLPPIYWAAPVLRARPGAETLVTAAGPAAARAPVFVHQSYGLGSVLFIGTDNLWRIRRNTGDTLHARLWGQILQRLALPHLLGESKRTQLSADKRVYAAGETAALFARLYSPTFEPLMAAEIEATLTPAGGQPLPITLRARPGVAGAYRGEARLAFPGTYSFRVLSDPDTQLDLQVTDSNRELADIAMNEPLLRELARMTGGAFLREEDLGQLPKLLAGKAGPQSKTAFVPLHASPLYFALIVGLLSTEWMLRKGAMLK